MSKAYLAEVKAAQVRAFEDVALRVIDRLLGERVPREVIWKEFLAFADVAGLPSPSVKRKLKAYLYERI